MRTLAVNAILLAGLGFGLWLAIWVTRRVDLSSLPGQGFPRHVVWILRTTIFLFVLSAATIPFDLIARVVE